MTELVTINAESDTGTKRKDNQDYYDFRIPEDETISQKGILMTVADGMGGHSGGQVASSTAVNVLMKEYYSNESGSIAASLTNAFHRANESVFDKSTGELAGMGTTMTAAVLKDNEMYYAHIGDSRGYLIADEQISQFTEDHSYVAGLVKAGVINEDEAKTHPERNKITRAIGTGPKVLVDVSTKPKKVNKGDYLLLCSDGLHGPVSDQDMLDTVLNNEPAEACKKLVEMAKQQGGLDNITVLIARIAVDVKRSGGHGLIKKLIGIFE